MTHEFRYPKVVAVPPTSAAAPAPSQRALVEASLVKCPSKKPRPQRRA